MRAFLGLVLAVALASCSSGPGGQTAVKGDDPQENPQENPQEDPQQPMVFEWDGVNPPFPGTAWVSPDLITPEDPTALGEAPEYRGIEYRNVPDRRVIYVHGEEQIPHEVHVYRSRYRDDVEVEVFVNSEFELAEANALARRYASMLGQMPMMVRATVRSMVIHDGNYPWGGGSFVQIHTGWEDLQGEREAFAEEIMAHEVAHSADPLVLGTPEWTEAQELDGVAISEYAAEYPLREDFAETFLLYAALRLLPERLPAGVADAIEQAIPNRLAYLDALPWEDKWCPVILEDCSAEAQE